MKIKHKTCTRICYFKQTQIENLILSIPPFVAAFAKINKINKIAKCKQGPWYLYKMIAQS